MPQLARTCFMRILPRSGCHASVLLLAIASTTCPNSCYCYHLVIAPQHLMPKVARTCSTKILPRSDCHTSVLLPQPLRLSPSAAIRCSAASCVSLVRLLLCNRAPTLALISRAFYPAVVVTPLSSKLPQPLLLFSSAVIRRAVASSAPKVHSLHPLVPRAFYPAVVITPLSSKLPQPLRLSPSAAICRVF
jgi:hypothetical protein